jgi:1,2-phenylacetyl-CoA epoxidase catalytic subunit
MTHTSNRTISDAVTAETIATAGEVAPEAVARYAVGLGDDALILAQRLGAWIAHAPELEEDVALGNIDPIQTHSIMIIAAIQTMQASNTIVLISMFDSPACVICIL